ncbi:MAG: hypothetical protein OXQ90_03850 [Gammaproteobacteria bacterium]|nr:hypothetical protein [Gammaproteobacteria bacterium]
MTEKTTGNGIGVYCGLWIRLVVVTVVSLWLYFRYVDVLVEPVLSLLGVKDEIRTLAAQKPLISYGGVHISIVHVVKVIVGVLFWWRAVKSLVLLGWPFMFGVRMTGGRQTGKLATLAHIGDLKTNYNSDTWKFTESYDGKFWFGLVARTHPTSDKIVRSRIEYLCCAFFGLTFLSHEGRMALFRQTHEDRALSFLRARHPHVTVKDNGQETVANALNGVREDLRRQVNRKQIDGLNWQKLAGGRHIVSNDFGESLMVTRLSGDRFAVGGDRNDPLEVNGMDAVRRVVQERLFP